MWSQLLLLQLILLLLVIVLTSHTYSDPPCLRSSPLRIGAYQCMEGEGHARNVVIEFPSFQEACGCYNSVEYQEAKALREGAGIANITMVEGV